ncbi:MAG: divergent polysaccharide deacetylase family protein [Alphaproteobacteria bacterium]|nr:divergent polysaccharide deacetylase family protein [Alphaproteobacteria bacterium]
MKLPRLPLPVFVTQNASRVIGSVRALPRRVVITIGVTLGVVLLFLGVSLLPAASPDTATVSTVIRLKLDGAPKKPSTGLLDPGSGGTSGATVAGSLIAANGAVISDPHLIEMTDEGPLPRIAADGRTPLSTYSRKTDTKEIRPRIAIVVTGLGLNQATSMAAIDTLPPGATLGFSPYGRELQGLVSAARGNGNEVVMELPLEPYDFPNNDPGQNTLIAGASSKMNGDRLRWVLSRFTGYAGLVSVEGGKFLSSSKDTGLLLDAVGKRGVYFLDSAVSDQSVARDEATRTGTNFARANLRVDASPSQETIADSLAALEKLAMQRGSAIGVAGSYPGTIGQIATWANELEKKGIALVPVSALLAPGVDKPAPAPSKAEARGTPEARPPALRRSDDTEISRPAPRPRPGGKAPAHDADAHTGPHP